MLNPSYWKGRRVFLTGHTGFKGSWLSLWLAKLGAEATGYALPPPTQPSLFELAKVEDSIRSIYADIRDFEKLRRAIEECRPDVVIHMAAQTVVRTGYENPIETYASNVMGTVNLLEAVRQIGHPCAVVSVTSDKCYENREWVWAYRENDAFGGRDPYSNSKACAELVTSAFRDSYFSAESWDRHGVTVASARAGNVVGGGDWTAHQLIPDLMRAFLNGQECVIRNPSATRPWQFVLEPLRGYLMVAERLSEHGCRFASGWNFGPADDDAKPVSWIADSLARSWGESASWTRDKNVHEHEAHALKLDASKAKECLGWRPKLSLETALEWIVKWYRAFQAKQDLRKLTLKQIEDYEALLRD